MNNEDYERIIRLSRDKIDEVSLDIKRAGYDGIDWSFRLIGLKGSTATTPT